MSLSTAVLVILGFVMLARYGAALLAKIRRRVALYKLPTLTKTAYPLIGHSHLFKSDPTSVFRMMEHLSLETIAKTREKLGVMWFGPFAVVMVHHPEAAEVFLKSSSRHTEKSAAYRYFRSWLRDGLVMSHGEKWRQRRRLITPAFHFNILEDFLAVMNEQSTVLMRKFESAVSEGDEGIDVAKLFGLCALDIICETAMGCHVNAQVDGHNDYVDALQTMTYCIDVREGNPLYASDFIFERSAAGKLQRTALETLHGFTRKVILDRIDSNSRRGADEKPKRMALLDVLLHAETDDGKSLSPSDIQEEVDTFMFAGHDTSMTALTWAIYLLGRYPAEQRKLQDELDAVFDGVDLDAPISTEQLRKLTYLDQVVKEVLRLYPPGAMIGRNVAEDCTIAGHHVPKDSEVYIFVYMIQRHPDLWTNPNKFDPDRFAKGERIRESPYEYIPFSAGQRNCIGQRFAMQEQKVILAKFFRRFSVVSHDEEKDLAVSSGVAFCLLNRLNLTITKRD